MGIEIDCQNRMCYIDFPDPAVIPKYLILGWREVSGYGTQQRNMGTQLRQRALFPEEHVIGPFRATVRTPRNPFAPSIFRLDQTFLNFIRVHDGTIPVPETTPAPVREPSTGPVSNTRSQSLGNNAALPETPTAPGIIKEEPNDENVISQTTGVNTNNSSALEVTTQVPLIPPLLHTQNDHTAYTCQMQPPAAKRTRTQ